MRMSSAPGARMQVLYKSAQAAPLRPTLLRAVPLWRGRVRWLNLAVWLGGASLGVLFWARVAQWLHIF